VSNTAQQQRPLPATDTVLFAAGTSSASVLQYLSSREGLCVQPCYSESHELFI